MTDEELIQQARGWRFATPQQVGALADLAERLLKDLDVATAVADSVSDGLYERATKAEARASRYEEALKVMVELGNRDYFNLFARTVAQDALDGKPCVVKRAALEDKP